VDALGRSRYDRGVDADIHERDAKRLPIAVGDRDLAGIGRRRCGAQFAGAPASRR
jgi:hypothetical protein